MPVESIEVYCEEPSCEQALTNLLPRILPPSIEFRIYTSQGKDDLLRNLPTRLRAHSRYLRDTERIVVLVDQDDDDCGHLKTRLEQAASRANLRTPSTATRTRPVQVINRIAIEELESWFFGDVPALCRAFPGVPTTLAARAPFRDPDAITGGTAERLERVLRDAGYYRGGLAKVDAARRVSTEMDPASNRSPSFNAFRDALLSMVS